MHTILMAVDDGIVTANYNLADLFFLVATVLALIAAVAAYGPGPATTDAPRLHGWHHWTPALLALAVACTAFALFLL